MRVLTWNLKHGRAEPSAGRDLFGDFAERLAAWEWDAALLQEVPPWWPERLGVRTGAEARRVLTSRNFGLAARRALAERWPDAMKSNGGGANAVLVRGSAIREHRVRRLCRYPERRWLQAVHVRGPAFGDGVWIGNLHATAHHDPAAARDDARAARTMLEWSGAAPCILGGDFNLRALTLAGLSHAGGHDVDHVFVRGLEASGPAEVLDRGVLSDHAPVRVRLTRPG